MQRRRPSYLPQAIRYQNHGYQHHEHRLDRVHHRRGLESAEHDEDRHEPGGNEVEGDRLQVRDIGSQDAAIVIVAQRVVPRLIRGRQRAHLTLGAQRGEFVIIRHHLPLGRRVDRLILHHQRLQRLQRRDIAARDHSDHGDHQHRDRIRRREKPAAETVLEQVCHRRQSHAAEPDVHEPVVRGQKQRDQRQPGAACSLPIHRARRRRGLPGVGHVAETQEELQPASQRTSAQEEVLLSLHSMRQFFPDPENDDDVREQDADIDPVQAEKFHKGRGRTRSGVESVSVERGRVTSGVRRIRA